MCENKVCPLLLDSSKYSPDTLDLRQDEEARNYWLECFKNLVDKFSIQAALSQRNIDESADERATNFRNDYIKKINILKKNEKNLESLTIRKLLDLNESCLRDHGFSDPWYEQKQSENMASILRLKQRLTELDKLQLTEKWIEIFRGVLAGNIFDWGANAVTEILQNEKSFGLYDALKKIQKRPWLIDGLDHWLERIKNKPPHTCAVIFVDNSGVDLVLGILPFARELLLRNTKVILCANTEPSLNDITYKELENVLHKCFNECIILKNSYENKQLLIFANGQCSPCLDLLNLPEELCEAILINDVDLLIIEGMGRALHTNLNAKFKCETLKLAVIKNKWLANRLGGDTFSVICKYENENV